MRRIALLLVLLLAEGAWAWEFGWTVGVDKFPVSQVVQRGLDLNQELGIEFHGPQFGFIGGLTASRPWRNFKFKVAVERLQHGENSVNWQAETPGLEIDYQGSGAFPAWLVSIGLSYPIEELGQWELSLESGLSLVWANCWFNRQGRFQTAGQDVSVTTLGQARGLGLGSLTSLSCSRPVGEWQLFLEIGYRLAHVRARGSYYEEAGGSASELHPLTVEADYDGPFLKLGFNY